MNRLSFILIRSSSVLLLIWSGACDSSSTPPSTATRPSSEPQTQPAARYAGSSACAECHKQEHNEWHNSHHALAQRSLQSDLDREAFAPPREIKHVSQTSHADILGGRLVLTTLGPEGEPAAFEPVGVLAVDPLRQYLIPFPGGRLQVSELAFDPAKKEWFDVYGNEDRKSHEWGHWTGRGMNWNSMCATCHTTAFQKNYDPAQDAYQSKYLEMGVGCEACHGPMQSHVDWQKAHRDKKGDPTTRPVVWDTYFDTCIACHARRADLTGKFRAGDRFDDHYELILPDITDTFYPDGQVREEDFEGGPFSMSYMHAQGIRCIDCHGAHTAAPNVRTNALCLRCHENGIGSKTPINEQIHGHHALGTPGSRCFDCHMPETAYMQRHLRRDHGMTIPDPLLTKEHGIPNACMRCHADKPIDWAIETVNTWYGPRMERPTRTRARLLARLKKSDLDATAGVLDLLGKETNPAWRAVEAHFFANAIQEPRVQGVIVPAIIKLLGDASSLVQSAAIETLESVLDASLLPAVMERAVPALEKCLSSPSRVVRIKAAWALRRSRPWEQSGAGADARKAHAELLAMLTENQDQPLGAFRWAQYEADTGHPEKSIEWYEKAIRWDPNAGAFRHAYAMTLDVLGKPQEALLQAARAAELEPDQPMHSYALGLLYAELGKLPEARDALKAAVARDPRQPRYWYNLALAESKLGEGDAAVAALKKTEELDPASADFPYVRATIHVQAGQLDEARKALQRALQIDPKHAAAQSMIQQLNQATPSK